MAFGVTSSQAQNVISPVQAAPTSVIGLLAITTWGPTDDPFETTSFPEWQTVWGPPTLNGFGYLWAQAAYALAGDGLRLVTKRIVHLTDVSNPASKTSAAASSTVTTASLAASAGHVTSSNPFPHNLEPGDTLVITDDTGPATATFSAVAAHVDAGGNGPFALTDGMTLIYKVNRVLQPNIVFHTSQFVSIGAATATEVAAAIAGQAFGLQVSIVGGKVRLTSTLRGTDSHVEITGGTANAQLTYSTSEQNGSGNVANIDAVTFNEEKSIIEGSVPGSLVTAIGGFTDIASTTLGSASSMQVTAPSTADTAMGFDNATHVGIASGVINRIGVAAKFDGARGNHLAPRFSPATNGDALSFNMIALENGVPTGKQLQNLSVDSTSANYFVTRVNDAQKGSDVFIFSDLAVGNPARPNLISFGAMTGGADGLGSIGDADFNGNAGGRTGLFGLDPIENVPGTSDIAILAVPDRPTSSVHNNMATYCEITREGLVHGIVDMPAGLTGDQAITYVKSTASLLNLSQNLCVTYDRVQVDNSRPDVYGTVSTVTIPNSCIIAGVWARTDAARPGGISDPPGGKKRGKVGTVVRGMEMGQAQNPAIWQKLVANRINTIIRPDLETGFIIRGTVTLRSDGQFPDIQESRFASFVVKSLQSSFQGVMDDPTEDGLKSAEIEAKTFLQKLARAPFRCFRTEKASDAFSVDFGFGLNPASSRFEGDGFGNITLATKKSLKRLGIVVGQNFADIQAELAQQRAA